MPLRHATSCVSEPTSQLTLYSSEYGSASSHETQGRIRLNPAIPELGYPFGDNTRPDPAVLDLLHSHRGYHPGWPSMWDRGSNDVTSVDSFSACPSQRISQINFDWTTLNRGDLAAGPASATHLSLSSDFWGSVSGDNTAYTSTLLVNNASEESNGVLANSEGSGSEPGQILEPDMVACGTTLYGPSGLVDPCNTRPSTRPHNEGSLGGIESMILCPYEKQKRLFREAETLPCVYHSHLVPQKMYRPPMGNKMARHTHNAQLFRPIYFWRGSTCGLPLTDILTGKLDCLNGKDEVVFAGSSQSILIKLKWPGYRSWAKQVATVDFRRKNNPISLRRVAGVIAKKIQRFFQDVELQRVSKKSVDSQEESSFATSWRISPSHIRLENIILISIHNVSQGVWQPQIRLRNHF